jgi:O-acetyl-ADP-ribose deacetylase (regulator of RNase III)|tara:strand:+ start:649 stop:1143 length:495 start_codon:yes stop_codon:yes gene_type:complete
MEIRILHEDLLRFHADAIVNPSNTHGFMGGGIAEDIKKEGGQDIEMEAAEQSPIPIGTAVLTQSGKLRCEHIIHAPTMEQPEGETSLDYIKEATQAALECAEEHKIAHVAMPGLGSGKIPKEDAAKAMIEAIVNFDAEHVTSLTLIDEDIEMVKAWHKIYSGKV